MQVATPFLNPETCPVKPKSCFCLSFWCLSQWRHCDAVPLNDNNLADNAFSASRDVSISHVWAVFLVYLRLHGCRVIGPQQQTPNSTYPKVNISELLHAETEQTKTRMRSRDGGQAKLGTRRIIVVQQFNWNKDELKEVISVC
ncbi:hypothetical protein L596_005119 [Steinernema carpocapsae]|uniref:Uncharacterized protein n=1 Tax=Steinernema carpocapsae TaxID=34508 RepID=A0A4U8UXY0_STECR|nr:hypothetical protein L596_005119 [Steinernema carpocapsae]